MAATNLFVRKTGSDANGGSSNGTSAQRTGTDGVTNGTTTFTSASAAFTAGDVDKFINIVGRARYRILTINSGTSVLLSGSPAGGSGLTWNIGGAVLTVGALLQAAAAPAGTIVNGDAIWIGAGTYRETITCGVTNTAEVIVSGDVDGVRTGDAGMVQLTAFTTNDKTAPSSSALLALSNSDFLTFKNIMFVGGTSSPISQTNATDISFIDCAFLQGAMGSNIALVSITPSVAVAMNWLFDRCILFGRSGASVTLPTRITSDYDANIVIRNSLLWTTGVSVDITASGALSNKGGGVRLFGCTVAGSNPTIRTNSANISTTFPCLVENCVIYSTGTALSANTSGQIVDQYNMIYGTRTNVTAGTGSVDNTYASLPHVGQERIWGGLIRPYMSPMAGSGWLGFGDSGTATAYDQRNGRRPAGGASALKAVGAMERGNSFITDPSPIGAGGSAIKVTGPGYAEFLVPVPARAITISCVVKWDATYAGTKPQLQIDANGRIGVVAETKTATGSSGSNETLTLTAFTPTTAGGMVTVRVISNDTNGSGVLQVDNFSVTG